MVARLSLLTVLDIATASLLLCVKVCEDKNKKTTYLIMDNWLIHLILFAFNNSGKIQDHLFIRVKYLQYFVVEKVYKIEQNLLCMILI